jgi:hypothetical protein
MGSPSMRIHVCLIQENGTTKSIPRTDGEMRIYVVAPTSLSVLPPTVGRGPAHGRSDRRGRAPLVPRASGFA